MPYTTIGTATIGHQATTIRRYDNGLYIIEVNGAVMYHSETLDGIQAMLRENNIEYIVLDNN